MNQSELEYLFGLQDWVSANLDGDSDSYTWIGITDDGHVKSGTSSGSLIYGHDGARCVVMTAWTGDEDPSSVEPRLNELLERFNNR